ncbi:SAM-dependent methyltransferase [Saccharopolyspora spinosa]|uniref:SAM-dependent methyltransferase n=1 Tax=Saccharopolyspora spinosa TaxID=60894 RepID=UPI00192BE150|nr:SAM-dependent methyltransferase [Saccharopolyspora spinosa]
MLTTAQRTPNRDNLIRHATHRPRTNQRARPRRARDSASGVKQPRSPEEIADLLGGCTIVDPGVVPMPLWRPDRAPTDDEVDRSNRYGAVGHRR